METTVSACGVVRRYDAGGRLVELRMPDDGELQIHAGERGQERKVKVFRASGGARVAHQHFEGDPGAERKVATRFFRNNGRDDGSTTVMETEWVFAGEKGNERKVREVEHFGRWVGDRWYPGRVVLSYTGPRKNEWLEFVVAECGTREMHERCGLCSIHRPSGAAEYYRQIDHGDENGRRRTLDECRFPDGRRCFYRGLPGREALARECFPDGTEVSYRGEKNHERIVKRLDGATKHVYKYAGTRGCEHVVGVQAPKSEMRAEQRGAVRNAYDELEILSEDGHCNEHAFNQLAKRLKSIHELLHPRSGDDDRQSV